MKTKLLTFFCTVLLLPTVYAQFAPQVGLPGSTAIHKSHALIKAWASECVIQRGFQDIANTSLGYTGLGDSTNVLGMADGEVVSLGDSGVATVKFTHALYNGIGADFAVFENGFQNPSNFEEAYSELAFVAVSSDGERFFTFPATSNTPIAPQIKGVGEYMNARLLNNLAGKYIAQNGTPFDLEELKDTPGLDINNITHIRITDVVGSVSGHGSLDYQGQIINDPYPTAFLTGGFDLDAVAAINIKGLSIDESIISTARIYPNPVADKLFVDINSIQSDEDEIVISDLMGKILLLQKAKPHNEISIGTLNSGLHLIGIRSSTGIQWIGKCSKI